MPAELTPTEAAKRAAARRAARMVESGMVVGLGTGSTAAHLIDALAAMAREEGLEIACVATSERSGTLAALAGLDVIDIGRAPRIDIAIDGADEFDAGLNLIKGGGGALLREKIVATAAERMVVIADASKEVRQLGAFPLPVEVVPFGWEATRRQLQDAMASIDVMGREAVLRMDGDAPYRTDGGNHIIDLHLKRIANPWQTAMVINQVPGAVENGLFVDVCDVAVIGGADGGVELRDAAAGTSMREPPEEDGDNLFRDVAD